VDGVDSDDQMKRLFSWGESQHNAYGNYAQLLVQLPWTESEAMAPLPYGQMQWKDFTDEQGSRFDKVRFAAALGSEVPLARSSAVDFKLKTEANLQGYGVNVDNLPKASEKKPPSGSSSTN
jgi:hypothetical protein